MDTGRIRTAEQVFYEVVDLDPAQRDVIVAERCGSDTALTAYVRSLLQNHDGGMGGFLETPPTVAPPAEALPMPETIGVYHILGQLGEGGMGIVYLAEQHTPVRRRVAVKVITPGMDTRRLLARFEAERQVLAMMDHSCIARIFDAGATPEGRPYFVMEYIVGAPITSYCDVHRLSIEKRVRLFARVCGAVQHAHQRGVIHRDLKPTNVLIAEESGEPQPKIIDFGVAKASTPQFDGQASLTMSGQLIGTLEYMSPEQVEDTSGDLDVRSDVYSLGVMLYELLAGVLPIDSPRVGKAPLTEVLHSIKHTSPAMPSARLTGVDTPRASTLAENRGVTLSLARRQLRGDLDWITMKAIEKDRERRYWSALELSADIERHLSGEPVHAAPPGAAYRIRKLVQRHKARTAFSALLALALVAGGTFAFLLALTKAREAESQRVAQHYEEARTLDWHVDDGHLTSFPIAWEETSAEVIARVASKIYAGESNVEEMRQFTDAMMRYRVMGSPLQSTDTPRITLTMGGRRRAANWPGRIGARIVPTFEINAERIVLEEAEANVVVLDLASPEQLAVSFGELPAVRSRVDKPGSYCIRGGLALQLVRIPSDTASHDFPVVGLDAAQFSDAIGPEMEFVIAPFDFTVVERMPFVGDRDALPAGAEVIDLTAWRAEHYRPDVTPGIWARSRDAHSVEQIQHGGVTLFVSDSEMGATHFACTIQVLTADDDDYAGVVFSFRGLEQGYYAFYWKQFGQSMTAGSTPIDPSRWQEGMYLIKVAAGTPDHQVLRPEPTSGASLLASHVGPGMGWQDFRRYLIDVRYEPTGRLRVTVSAAESGRLLWDSGLIVDPEPLGPGKFGFFNHSQAHTLYSAYLLPADASPAALE